MAERDAPPDVETTQGVTQPTDETTQGVTQPTDETTSTLGKTNGQDLTVHLLTCAANSAAAVAAHSNPRPGSLLLN